MEYLRTMLTVKDPDRPIIVMILIRTTVAFHSALDFVGLLCNRRRVKAAGWQFLR